MAHKTLKSVSLQARSWRKHVQQWGRSGATQVQYCKEHKLSVSAFRWWRRKLKGDPPAERKRAKETGSGLICVDLPRRATVHRSGRRRFGRPGGLNVDSNPRRFAVACCQTVSPKGVPTWALRLTRCHKLEVLVLLNRKRLEPPEWASRKRRAAACRPAPETYPPVAIRGRRGMTPSCPLNPLSARE